MSVSSLSVDGPVSKGSLGPPSVEKELWSNVHYQHSSYNWSVCNICNLQKKTVKIYEQKIQFYRLLISKVVENVSFPSRRPRKYIMSYPFPSISLCASNTLNILNYNPILNAIYSHLITNEKSFQFLDISLHMYKT